MPSSLVKSMHPNFIYDLTLPTMEKIKVHILMCGFKNNKNAKERAKKFSSVFGQGVIIDRQVRNWFSKFRSGDRSWSGEPKTGHSSDLNRDAFSELMFYRISTFQYTICRHLKKIGKVCKLEVCLPHILC